MTSGCCMLAGVGMEEKKKETKSRNDAWHRSMINAIDGTN